MISDLKEQKEELMMRNAVNSILMAREGINICHVNMLFSSFVTSHLAPKSIHKLL